MNFPHLQFQILLNSILQRAILKLNDFYIDQSKTLINNH